VSSVYEASNETNDASIYVATARALLAGERYSYLGEPFVVRPPGFPVLLAGTFAVFGEHWRSVHLVIGLAGVAACVLLYVLCVPRLGVSIAFLLAVGLFAHPELRALSNQVMSDVPGLALLLGCLVLERRASQRPSWRRDVVLGVAIGLATWVRTANVLLLPAILLARAFAREAPVRPWSAFLRGRVVVLTLACAACVAPWSIRCALRHPEPPVDQTAFYSYATGMWRTRPYDPDSARHATGEILRRIPARVEQIVTSEYLGGRGRAPRWIQIAVGALLLATAAWMLAERRRASELWLFLYLALLCVYFASAFRPRLLLPAYALLAPAVLETVLNFPPIREWTRYGRLLVSAVAGGWLLSSALLLGRDDERRADIEARHVQYEAAAATLRPALGDERVASAIGWHWSVYLRRPVWSLALAARRDDGPGLAAVLARRDIRTVVLADFLPEDQALVPWFERAWGPAERVGNVSVFRRP
jgi:4-amino-4-deoxy-L-arabinose transferase-like glycosyltransferase